MHSSFTLLAHSTATHLTQPPTQSHNKLFFFDSLRCQHWPALFSPVQSQCSTATTQPSIYGDLSEEQAAQCRSILPLVQRHPQHFADHKPGPLHTLNVSKSITTNTTYLYSANTTVISVVMVLRSMSTWPQPLPVIRLPPTEFPV